MLFGTNKPPLKLFVSGRISNGAGLISKDLYNLIWLKTRKSVLLDRNRSRSWKQDVHIFSI